MPVNPTYLVVPEQGFLGLGTRPAQPTRTEKNLCCRPSADRNEALAQAGLSRWHLQADGILPTREIGRGKKKTVGGNQRPRKEKLLLGAPLLLEISLCF